MISDTQQRVCKVYAKIVQGERRAKAKSKNLPLLFRAAAYLIQR